MTNNVSVNIVIEGKGRRKIQKRDGSSRLDSRKSLTKFASPGDSDLSFYATIYVDVLDALTTAEAYTITMREVGLADWDWTLKIDGVETTTFNVQDTAIVQVEVIITIPAAANCDYETSSFILEVKDEDDGLVDSCRGVVCLDLVTYAQIYDKIDQALEDEGLFPSGYTTPQEWFSEVWTDIRPLLEKYVSDNAWGVRLSSGEALKKYITARFSHAIIERIGHATFRYGEVAPLLAQFRTEFDKVGGELHL